MNPISHALQRLGCIIGLVLWVTPARAQEVNFDPIPGYYEEGGASPNRDMLQQHEVEHIDPFTGKLQFHHVDLFVPGNGGLDIRIQRSYSSGDGFLRDPSPYGVGWTMGFGRVLRRASIAICVTTEPAAVAPVLETVDGNRQILYSGTPGLAGITSADQFITTTQWRAECAPGGFGLIVNSPDGTRYEMTTPGPLVPPGGNPATQQQSWYPSRIVDRNGNSLNIEYQNLAASLGVRRVTASDGRVVDFTYQNGCIRSVSDGARTVTYDSQAIAGVADEYQFLTEVTRPDGFSWRYGYVESTDAFDPGALSINRVTYPTSGVFDYDYGLVSFNVRLPQTHVITRKAGDRGQWTFDYQPSTGPFDVDQESIPSTCSDSRFDHTTVDGPDGRRVYCHFGYNSIAHGGLLYALGVRVASLIGDVREELYGHAPRSITTRQNLVLTGNPLILSADVAAAQVTVRAINQDNSGFSLTYSGFDAFGNPTRVVESGTATRETTLSYNVIPAIWRLRDVREEESTVDGVPVGQVSRTFDDVGNRLSETRYGVTTSWTYDPDGNVQTKTDARSNSVRYSDYHRGVPRREEHPEGVVLTRSVDGAGNITREVDGEGNATDFEYDGLSRITAVSYPTGNPVSVIWTARSRTATRGAAVETTRYDTFGRVEVVEGPVGRRVEQSYDSVGRMIYSTDPNGDGSRGTRFSHDILGRVLEMGLACSSSSGACEANTRYEYQGNVVREFDELNRLTQKAYRIFCDPAERELIEIATSFFVGTESMAVQYLRNGVGQITSATQAGVTRTFEYDERFFLVASTEPETGTTVYGRDEVGNMTSRRVGSAAPVRFQYDGLNRLTDEIYPPGTASVRRAYDDRGLLTAVDNGVARREFAYDGNQNLRSEVLSTADQSWVIGYRYDDNDALDVITYPSGSSVTYAPDAAGRPTTAAPYARELAYRYPAGPATSYRLANDVLVSADINSRNWMSSTSARAFGAALLDSRYEYSPTGNLTQIVDSVDPLQNRNFGYDPVNRLTQANGPWGVGSLSYDGAGNILRQVRGSVALEYQYDARERLERVTGSSERQYEYDAFGDIVGDGSLSFLYNDAQQLVCVSCGEADEARYEYDGLDQRVATRRGDADPLYSVHTGKGELLAEVVPGESLREFIYVAGRQIAVRDVDLALISQQPPGDGVAALTVTLDGPTGNVAAGSSIRFTLTVTNTGTRAAAETVAALTVPASFSFASASPGCARAGGTVSCSVGTLGAAATSSFDIELGTTTPVSASATAVVSSRTPNTTAESAVATVPITVVATVTAANEPESAASTR